MDSNFLGDFFSAFNQILWGWPMIIILIGTHVYLTIRLRFPQRYILKAIKLSVSKERGSDGDISPLGALMTSLAATVGTGNIIGVATAISLGGPGAVLWCWLTGVFGMATKYAEALLAVKYREKNSDGQMAGGPMYVLRNGMNLRILPILFCIFTALAALGIGSMVQANALSLVVGETLGISSYVTGAVVALLVALVVFFGIKGIARTCTFFVPFMAVFYVLGCVTILILNHAYLADSLALIVKSAFSVEAVGGGFLGSSLMVAARYGIARGLFSNESGMGSAPIVAAAAKSRNPVRQALVSSSATFWDTVVICALTGLVIVSSCLANPSIDMLASDGTLTYKAFDSLPYVGHAILAVGIFSFAFSTILGWSYYAEKSIEYMAGVRWIIPYRILFVVAVFVGAVIKLQVVWDFADCMNALMAIPNLISLIFLAKVAVAETRRFLK